MGNPLMQGTGGATPVHNPAQTGTGFGQGTGTAQSGGSLFGGMGQPSPNAGGAKPGSNMAPSNFSKGLTGSGINPTMFGGMGM